MPRNVADVDEAVLVRDWYVCAVGTEIFGHCFRFLGVVVHDDGVGNGEVQTKVFDVA